MKKLVIFLTVGLLCSFADLKDPITEKERKFASDFLVSTQDMLTETVQGLSEAQLKFKPAADRWSIEDCTKHIAMAQQGLWHMTDSVLNQPANPDKRKEIKATDEQVVKMIVDRSQKFKAPEPIQPQNTPYTSFSEALESFTTNHQKLIDFVKETDKDLRNHVVTFPVGHFDTYQMILFIGAHSQRHIKQMQEVKQDPGFPKE